MARARNADPTQEAREQQQELARQAHDADKAEVKRLRKLLTDIGAACKQAGDSRQVYGEGEGQTVLDALKRIEDLAGQSMAAKAPEQKEEAPAKTADNTPPVATQEDEPA